MVVGYGNFHFVDDGMEVGCDLPFAVIGHVVPDGGIDGEVEVECGCPLGEDVAEAGTGRLFLHSGHVGTPHSGWV